MRDDDTGPPPAIVLAAGGLLIPIARVLPGSGWIRKNRCDGTWIRIAFTCVRHSWAAMADFDLPRSDAALPHDPLPQPAHTQPSADTENVANFNEFYRGFVPILIVFLMWQGANFADAANIAQETMTTAYRRWSEIDHPKLWARTVASRKLARHIASVEEDPVEAPEGNSLLPDSFDQETWEQRHAILVALSHLSPRQRQVMAWTLDGYAPAEIASDLQINFQTVRANLTHGRRALAAYLDTTGDQR
jgi:RNA polymerase sigma factor (sigma-70 family)